MASNFVSSFVSRLFSGKSQRKTSVASSSKQTLLLSPPPEPRDKKLRKEKQSVHASIRTKTRPLSCIISHPDSPSGSKENLSTAGEDDVTKTRAHGTRKSQRPLSCFVGDPEEMTSLAGDRARDRNDGECGRNSSKAGESRHIKKNKRRPMSCIIENSAVTSPALKMTSLEFSTDPLERGQVEAVQRETTHYARKSSRPMSYAIESPQKSSSSSLRNVELDFHTDIQNKSPRTAGSIRSEIDFHTDIQNKSPRTAGSIRSEISNTQFPQHSSERQTYDLKNIFPPAVRILPSYQKHAPDACKPHSPALQDRGPQSIRFLSDEEVFNLRSGQLKGSRPHSVCLLSDAALYSDQRSRMSSNIWVPQRRTVAPKKYSSVDFLDKMDDHLLGYSPPPARPISFFTGRHAGRTVDSEDDEIFMSVEMLEKVNQPRPYLTSPPPRPSSCLVGSSDESGYHSSYGTSKDNCFVYHGLSASLGDICQVFDLDEAMADDEMSFERTSSFKKASSVSSLFRNDSIQDRSLSVMRRRRLKMRNRRHSGHLRSSSTETDDGFGDAKNRMSKLSLVDEDIDVSPDDTPNTQFTGSRLDGKLLVPRTRRPLTRLHSVQMKAWEIRLRRKQLLKKKHSCERLNRLETLV